jgi:hypothetical protein
LLIAVKELLENRVIISLVCASIFQDQLHSSCLRLGSSAGFIYLESKLWTYISIFVVLCSRSNNIGLIPISVSCCGLYTLALTSSEMAPNQLDEAMAMAERHLNKLKHRVNRSGDSDALID